MDVTKSTFASELPAIKEAIQQATFLAIDCEFTGLATSFNINAFDTPSQYYKQVHKRSKDFLVIQFGLCAFRYDAESKVFKEKSFNFFLFPQRFNKLLPDQTFLCQASSLEFLINNGFDFNKLFKEGIPYLNKEGQMKLQKALDDARSAKLTEKYDEVPIPDHMKELVDCVFMEIDEFIKSDEKERVLPPCHAFARRLIYQSLHSRVGEKKVALETRILKNNDRALVVTRPKTSLDLDDADKMLMREAIGFSQIIQLISASRKLVVGHNMLLDVCHTINRFLTDLPEDYWLFKQCAHCLFPSLIDTKHLGSLQVFKDLVPTTVLSKMLEVFAAKPFFIPKVISDNVGVIEPYSMSSPREHEAGYDAYITGLCLIAMWDYLGKEVGYKADVFQNINLLHPHINKLFLMRTQDLPYIRLDGPDLQPPRDHVFYLSFPKEWKNNEIIQLFSPFGYVRIAWINDSSAYVALSKRDQISAVLSTLSQSNSYKIMTYSQHQNSLEPCESPEVGPKQGELAGQPEEDIGFVVVRNRRKRRVSNGDEPGASVKLRKERAESEDKVLLPSLFNGKKTVNKTFDEDSSWD